MAQGLGDIMKNINLDIYLPRDYNYLDYIEKVLDNVNLERLSNHPVPINRSKLKEIFNSLVLN